MKFWPRKKDTQKEAPPAEKGGASNEAFCSAENISPGEFSVCVVLAEGKQKTLKTQEPRLKKLQYLSIVFIITASLLTHTYVFFEQHIVKAIITPVVVLISGFVYDKIWASQPPPEAPKDPKSDTKAADPKASKADPAPTAPAPATRPTTTPTPTDAKSTPAAAQPATTAPATSPKDSKEAEEKKKADSRFDPLSLDETRVKILLSLTDREKELKKWEELLQARENIVKSLEVQLQNRAKELAELKTVIESLAKANNEYAEKNLKHLVDIYEAMKPPAAAKIFDELPQSVLIGIIKAMNQKKASAILSAMNQDKVRSLTNTLAMIPHVPEKVGGKDPKKP